MSVKTISLLPGPFKQEPPATALLHRRPRGAFLGGLLRQAENLRAKCAHSSHLVLQCRMISAVLVHFSKNNAKQTQDKSAPATTKVYPIWAILNKGDPHKWAISFCFSLETILRSPMVNADETESALSSSSDSPNSQMATCAPLGRGVCTARAASGFGRSPPGSRLWRGRPWPKKVFGRQISGKAWGAPLSLKTSLKSVLFCGVGSGASLCQLLQTAFHDQKGQ